MPLLLGRSLVISLVVGAVVGVVAARVGPCLRHLPKAQNVRPRLLIPV